MEDFDEIIDQLRLRLDEKERTERRLARAEEALRDQQVRRKALLGELGDELKDVERLEGTSLTRLFHMVMSTTAEQLAKERQDVVRARLRLDECRAEVEEFSGEVEAMRARLEELGDAAGDLRDVMAAKEGALIGAGTAEGLELQELADRRSALRAELVQLDEARSAGDACRIALDEVQSRLGGARSMGTWDMIGGGLLVTSMKHSHLNRARSAAERAQRQLRRFAGELEDVELSGKGDLEFGGLLTFADYFFDGLLVDWAVQRRIRKASGAVVQAKKRVSRALDEVLKRRGPLRKELEEIARKRRTLLGAQRGELG